jgi:hypothetical protein
MSAGQRRSAEVHRDRAPHALNAPQWLSAHFVVYSKLDTLEVLASIIED